MGAVGVFARALHEAYLALARSAEDRRHGKLHGVRNARREAVEYDIHEVTQELPVVAVACRNDQENSNTSGTNKHWLYARLRQPKGGATQML